MKTKINHVFNHSIPTNHSLAFLLILTGFCFLVLWAFAELIPDVQAKTLIQTEKRSQGQIEANNEPLDYLSAIEKAAKEWNVPAELIRGIGKAESSEGTKWVGCDFSFNAWGIKSKPAETCNQYLKAYSSWEESANDIARILKTFYLNEGKVTPEQIVVKYVGSYKQHWINNVRTYYNP